MNDALGAGGTDVLVIFDEIENISPQTAASPHWRMENDTLLLWQTMRSFFQSPRKHRLTFCFVGTNPHLFEMPKIRDIDNPVYLFAPKTFIPMLSLSETTEMITRLSYFMGLDFSPSVITHLHQRFGGHPFFIRQLCSQIHKKVGTTRPRTVSIALCKEAEQDAGADVQRYVGEILGNLKSFYPDEYSMIEYLATGDRASFLDLADFDPSYVEHLIGYGLVVRRGDDFEFAFQAVEDGIKRSIEAISREELSDKWSAIGRRRNKLEEEIRRALYQWAMRLGPDDWNDAYKQCITIKRQGELGPITRQQAFSINSSRLYLIELMKFIQYSGQYETATTTLGDVVKAIEVVNRFRVDAHAKSISDGDYAELKHSLNLLEVVFVAPQ